jgi:hypothetical protein
MPRSYQSLPEREKQAIYNCLLEWTERAVDKEICDTQIIWIKMMCIGLHDAGCSMDEIIMSVAAWKRLYTYNSRLPDKAAQDAWLDAKMKEIFGESGFPEEFVQNLRNIGR